MERVISAVNGRSFMSDVPCELLTENVYDRQLLIETFSLKALISQLYEQSD